RLWVGGQETASAFAEVALDPSSGGTAVLGSITSPFFPANPAVVRAIAANNIGALFGGEFLTDDAQKLVATFNSNYNPPSSGGLPSFVGVGPTQFYTSALLPNGDLLVGGDVGIPSTGGATPDGGHVVELYRITPCGTVTTVAQFRNVGGYLVRNDIDNGNLVSPPDDINTTPNMGYRRVDVVDPPSIRAIATDPQGRIYVGGQFNQVGEGTSQNFIPWNNLVRLTGTGTIDATFQVGNIDPNPLPGYTVIRKGGPTGFGAPGTGFSTVDPKEIAEGTSGFCSAPPLLPPTGIGEKFDPNDGRVNAIVIQPDGKVLIGGEFKCYNEVPRGGIARLTSTGSLDQTFGDSSFSLPGVGDYQQCGNPVATSGLRNAPNTKYERARVNAILLETDGKVTVAGLFARANNVDRYNIARFNSDGTLDTSFATGPTGSIFPTGTSGLPSVGGAASNGRGGEIFALARQNLGPNAGRLLIGGAFNRILNPTGAAGFNLRTAFTRFQSDGRHDTTFAQ
ncbi:MAG: delta-60 repeat domain-containing protein, partial [Acidobacteriota bacterium]